MPTPQSVKEAATRVDEMIRQGGEGAMQQDAMENASAEAPEQPEAEQDDAPQQGELDLQGGEPQAPQPAQPAPAEDVEQIKKQAELWEQRYRSLNGMIESRDRQIENLHQLLARMETAQQQPQQPAEPEKPPVAITKDDVDSFGEDLIDLARRVAQSEYSEHEKKLQARIKELESQVSGVSEQAASSAQEQFLAKLKTRIPQLEKINTDPAFIGWLQESPTRQQMFNTAVQQLDVPGAAWFFETWAEKTAQPAPPPQTDPRLARQVAPGKSRSTPSPAQGQDGEKRQWTRSAIVEFYKNIGRHPQKERDRIERDIALAQQEGRVDFTK